MRQSSEPSELKRFIERIGFSTTLLTIGSTGEVKARAIADKSSVGHGMRQLRADGPPTRRRVEQPHMIEPTLHTRTPIRAARDDDLAIYTTSGKASRRLGQRWQCFPATGPSEGQTAREPEDRKRKSSEHKEPLR